MSKSDDMMYWTFKQLDSELQNFNCQPGEVVCVSTREKTIKPGEHDVLGIKIVNLGPERDFAVIVYPDKNSISPNFKFEGIDIIKLGYGEDNQIQIPILLGCPNRCCTLDPPGCIQAPKLNMLLLNNKFKIEANKDQRVPIGIQVPPTALPGTYVFDVFVVYDHLDPIGTLDCKDTGDASTSATLLDCFSHYGYPDRNYNDLYGKQVYKLYVKVL